MTRLIMLEIGGLGFVRAIRPSPRKLRGDVSLVIVDENNETLWFWIGNSVQYDVRRKAQGRVETISQEGHRIGGEVIGQGMPIVIIDQDQIENPETANQYSNLVALLEAPMEIKSQADAKGTMIYATLQSAPVKVTAVAPRPSSPETPTKPATKPTPAPVSTEEKKGTRFGLEVALAAILRVHQEVHLEYKTKGDTEEVIIESIEGLKHVLKRRAGKISFKWDSKTPKKLKDLVALELKGLAA